MFSLTIARLMWVLSLFVPGLHRFYLGKIGSGLLYFFTWNLGFLGFLIDGLSLPNMVAEANLREKYRRAISFEDEPISLQMRPARKIQKMSVEKVILQCAKNNNGLVTPGSVALEGDYSLDDAKKYLDKLASKGYSEMRITDNGAIVYVFPDFQKESVKGEFADL
ncbi:MAG: TM2 domain-containing protein [Spirochaetales bacterium]|nr:TM2 domain-containing protein [Spirochaetales bacterium]